MSLHDPDARPIKKGRLGRPVECGYKAQIVDDADGLVIDPQVMVGNPGDPELIVPAIDRIQDRLGTPKAVVADRGYGDAAVEDDLTELGVDTVVIPARADHPVPAAPTNTSPASAGWSSGAPAPRDASAASRGSTGWTAPASTASAALGTWVGHAILAHNLLHVAALT